jgi:hypothetical protein
MLSSSVGFALVRLRPDRFDGEELDVHHCTKIFLVECRPLSGGFDKVFDLCLAGKAAKGGW